MTRPIVMVVSRRRLSVGLPIDSYVGHEPQSLFEREAIKTVAAGLSGLNLLPKPIEKTTSRVSCRSPTSVLGDDLQELSAFGSVDVEALATVDQEAPLLVRQMVALGEETVVAPQDHTNDQAPSRETSRQTHGTTAADRSSSVQWTDIRH
jgi:hypothetical protein